MAAEEERTDDFELLNPQEITLDLPSGHRMAARVWGRDDARHFVLALHGFMDNAGTYDSLAPRLVAHSMRRGEPTQIVALDFLGHGRSDHLAEGEYGLLWYVQRAAQAAQLVFGRRRFAVIGHSLGGHVGFYLSATMQRQVTHLLMIDSPLICLEAERMPDKFRTALRERATRFSKQWRIYDTREAMAEKLRVALSHGGTDPTIDHGSAMAMVTRGSVRVSTEPDSGFRFSHDLRLKRRSLTYFTEEQRDAFAREIRCHTLMLVVKGGRFERGVMAPVRRYGIPHVYVAGSHHPHLDHPDDIATIIDAWLVDNPPYPYLEDDEDDVDHLGLLPRPTSRL